MSRHTESEFLNHSVVPHHVLSHLHVFGPPLHYFKSVLHTDVGAGRPYQAAGEVNEAKKRKRHFAATPSRVHAIDCGSNPRPRVNE